MYNMCMYYTHTHTTVCFQPSGYQNRGYKRVELYNDSTSWNSVWTLLLIHFNPCLYSSPVYFQILPT